MFLLELILQNDIMDDCNSSHFSFITVPLSLALKGGGETTIVCNWIGSSLNNLCQKGVLHSTACEYAWFCFWWVQIQAAVNKALYLKEPNHSQRNSISETTWMKDLKQEVSQSTLRFKANFVIIQAVDKKGYCEVQVFVGLLRFAYFHNFLKFWLIQTNAKSCKSRKYDGGNVMSLDLTESSSKH